MKIGDMFDIKILLEESKTITERKELEKDKEMFVKKMSKS